ncbi:MAG: flippase [bacterium]
MSNTLRIAHNFGLKLFADVYSRAGMLVFVIVIARTYGADAFGSYVLSFAVANIFYIVTEFGLHTLLIREIAKDYSHAHVYWEKFLTLKIILSGIAIAGVIITGLTLQLNMETAKILILATIWMIANSLIDAQYAYFTAFEKLIYVVYNTIFYRTVLYIIGFSCLIMGASLVALCSIIALSSVLGACTGMYIIARCFKSCRVRWDASLIKKMLYDAWPIALSGIFMSAYLRIDTILLSQWKGTVQAGIYNSAFKLYEPLLFIPSIFQSIILPVLTKYVINTGNNMQKTFIKAYTFMFITGLPISILFIIKSDWIIQTIFGKDYSSGSTALMFIAPAITLLFVNAIPSIVLISKGKQILNVYVCLIALICSVAGNLLLIPGMGFIGCALIVSLSQVIIFIIMSLILPAYICNKELFLNIFKIIVSGSIMGFILFKINLFSMNILLSVSSILICFVIYFFCIITVKIINIDELKKLFGNRQLE